MMRNQYLILVSLIFLCNGVDLCRQFTSHETCIASEVEKCGWENTRKVCLKTNDYLQGCSFMLNKPACVRQLGNLFGELAKCRFHNQCEVIPDLVAEKCSVNLSKSGCLAVQNPQEVCLWTNNTCVKITDQELIEIQDNFVNTLYSASACSHISGYLTMHHTVLWQLTLYRPDLLTEADNLYRAELGLSVSYSESYDDPSVVSMQNNYVKSDDSFLWYIIRQSKSITLGNLKLNSRSREGCIALEIENDTDFIMLFSLRGQIYGVNHVYCQYLTQNPQNYINAVYGAGYCIATSVSALRDENFTIENQINCKSLTVTQCLQFESLSHNCQIVGEEYEFGCIDNLNDDKNINCLETVCTNQQCKLNDGFYVDLYLLQCTNKCFLNSSTQEQCISITGCVWYNQHLDLITTNSMTYLTVCGPENSCDHIGLGKYYCQNLTAFCNWDHQTNRCHSIPQQSLQYLKCHQANNVLVCSMIQLSDQQCIWLKDTLKCINVLDDPLLRLHGMYNTQSAVNMVLCNHYSAAPTKYEIPFRTCTIVNNSLSKIYVNRYNCLKVMSGYCHWHVLLQTCQCDLDFTSLLCQDLVEVNEKVCQIAKLSNPSNTCLFSLPKMSCFETSDYSQYGCENNGLSKEICISLSKKGQYCQYEAGTCKLLTTSQISAILCTSLQYVNLETCIMHSAFEIGCYYDQSTQACTQPSKRLDIECTAYLNQYACQFASRGYCYFDLVASRCLDSQSLLNTFSCENSNVNVQTCTSITTYSQNCYWNLDSKRCFNYIYTSQFNNCDEYKNQTRAVCTALQTTLVRELMAENYCEFIDSKCQQSIEQISGCGETKSINVHRCSGFTDGNCVFINQTCSVLNESTRTGEIILTQIGCLQANINTCRKVRQNGAFCYYANTTTGMIIDKKCNEITVYTLTCSQIQAYSPNGNSCALATDICFYNNGACQSSTTKTDFNCYDIGISKSLCLLKTIGRCVYKNHQCQTLTIIEQSVECNVLNKAACSTYKFRKCYWDINANVCIAVTLVCEGNPSFTSSSYVLNYSVCSLTTSETCMAYKDKCVRPTTMSKMSCLLPGLNEQACLSIPDQHCAFRIGQCYESMSRTCEDMLFQQDCLTNNTPGEYCVYNNNKCYNVVSTLNACNAYSKTNYQYCQRYEECSYNFSTNECFHIIQNVQVVALNNCEAKMNSFDCSLTRNDLCYFDSVCKPFTLTICPHLLYYASEKSCKSIDGCQFLSTKNSGGFCLNTPITKCEQLPQFLCLDHIRDQLLCYLDNNVCKTNIFTNCNNITNQLVNYPACQSVSTPENTCLYDHNTKLCKSTQYQYTDCASATTDLQCILIRNTCYFVANACITTGTINEINRYGCLLKTDNAYKYDFVVQKCVLVSSIQSTCYHLNKQACLGYTNYIECQWINEQCSQIISLTNCTNLNKFACLKVQASNNQICQWNNNVCTTIIPNSNETCATRISSNLNALNQCSSIIDVPCIQKSNQMECEQLTNNLNICSGYGLNRLACLNKTPFMNCYWHANGYCEEAQLDIMQCTQDVSQSTCKNIITLGQYCKWDNGCKYVPVGNKCSDASNLNQSLACLAIVTMACEYNNLTGICSEVPITPIECLDRYNKNSCELVQTRKCAWDQYKCVIPIYKVMECQTFLNRYLCLQDTELACQWTTKCVPFTSPQVLCKDLQQIPLINQKGCRTFSKDPCTLLNEQCTPTISLDNLVEVYQILPYSDQYQSPQLTALCNELLTLIDCIGSRLPNQACIWNQNICQFADDFNQFKCTADLNKYACLLINTQDELCTWRDKCVYWDQSAIMSNVNINVCIQYSVGCIYEYSSCVSHDLDTLNCHSIGISTKTCLSLTRSSCSVVNGQCTDFVITNQKYCQDFVNVSPFVCATQKIVSCVYSSETQQCVPFQKGQEFGFGISIKACLSNEDTYSIWTNESCQILTFDIECDADYQVNAIVCTKIISRTPCVYDQVQMKCVSKFNRNQLRCSSAGLNEAACALVADEPCIFLDNKCQQFEDITAACLTIMQVNGKACSSVINQQCYYDDLNHNCNTPLILVNKCTTSGLNQEGCQTNSLCGWNVSQLTCSCKDEVNVSCEYETATLCFKNSKCTWDIKKCVYKQCYHLEPQVCEGTLDGKLCYMSQDGCAGATKCEDVINADIACSKVYFKGKHCYQYNNICISDTNYELLCPQQSECLDNHCILEFGACRRKECKDYNQKVCNSFDGCVWINQKCQILNSCSDIDIIEETDQELLCNQLSVDGYKCNWQYYAFLDDTKICTNRPCEFYGSTNRFCQGNEMNNYACVLNTNQVCVQCEQLTDPCYCESQENICYYQDNQCKSILCSNFVDKYDCNDSNRCYWSEFLKECSKLCTKITNQFDCDSRINECYYDALSSVCNEGTKTIPDLNVIIEIQTIHSQMMVLQILLILIIN